MIPLHQRIWIPMSKENQRHLWIFPECKFWAWTKAGKENILTREAVQMEPGRIGGSNTHLSNISRAQYQTPTDSDFGSRSVILSLWIAHTQPTSIFSRWQYLLSTFSNIASSALEELACCCASAVGVSNIGQKGALLMFCILIVSMTTL